ncbi:hypothetical protein [Sphingomonas oryzagri]
MMPRIALIPNRPLKFAALAGLLWSSACGHSTASPSPKPNDDYRAGASGILFPARIGSFARTSVRYYSQDGSDIGVDYQSRPARIHMSVFVYPAPAIVAVHAAPAAVVAAQDEVCRRETAKIAAAILTAFPNGNERPVARLARPDGRPAPLGYLSSATVPNAGSGTSEEGAAVFCYVNDRWLVSYRFSGALAGPGVVKNVMGFIRSLPLPSRAPGKGPTDAAPGKQPTI